MATWEANVRGTWTVVEACRAHGVARTVVAASDKVYGAHGEPPYREDFELRARYPYDVSKAAADLIARSYWHTDGLPVATTRLTNVYGGGDLNRSRLVPEAIEAALAGRAPVIRSDGTPERDFLYVDDAVEAYLAIARARRGGRARRGVQRRRRPRARGPRGRRAHLRHRGHRRRAGDPGRPLEPGATASSSTPPSCAS